MDSENFFKSETGNTIAPDSTGAPKTEVTTDYTVNESERVNDVSKKSRTGALLLGIFLGNYGAHNFYLGKPKRAVIQLLLTIIGTVIICIPMFSMSEEILEMLSQNVELTDDELFLQIYLTLLKKMVFGYIVMLIPSIWSLVEWIMVAAGIAKDGKGHPVKNW